MPTDTIAHVTAVAPGLNSSGNDGGAHPNIGTPKSFIGTDFGMIRERSDLELFTRMRHNYRMRQLQPFRSAELTAPRDPTASLRRSYSAPDALCREQGRRLARSSTDAMRSTCPAIRQVGRTTRREEHLRIRLTAA